MSGLSTSRCFPLKRSSSLQRIRYRRTRLRERGWIVSAYTMAPKLQNMRLLRVVVREDFSLSRCELLVRDIAAALKALDAEHHR